MVIKKEKFYFHYEKISVFNYCSRIHNIFVTTFVFQERNSANNGYLKEHFTGVNAFKFFPDLVSWNNRNRCI